MAYAIVGSPGTTYGPCEQECKHIDCVASRQRAETVCHYCGEPIGYERPYTTDPYDQERLVHNVCAHEAVEREREARA